MRHIAVTGAGLALAFGLIAPAGTIAPVEIATASPGPTAAPEGDPARDSPIRRRTTGLDTAAPAVSAARTAYPSIAELSKPGTSACATTAAASRRPSAERSGTGSASGDGERSRTAARAVSMSIRPTR